MSLRRSFSVSSPIPRWSIPSSVSTPTLWGLPRTLWLGLLIYLAIVAVTFVATRVHPDIDDEEGDSG